ncbi:MAG: HmuY family protein [Polyangiales bacterium]
MILRTSLSLLLFAGCADPIGGFDAGPGTDAASSDATLPDGGPTSVPTRSGNFLHDDNGSSVDSLVDASDTESWQYLDLDTGMSTDDPAEWDLAFRRFFVRVNGGVTGNAGVLTHISSTAYESLAQAPDSGWSSAEPDGAGDDDDEPDNVFNNGSDDWYDYDVTTHSLSAKPRAYALRSSAGSYFRLQFVDYYDGAGSPAQIAFRWSGIDGPSSGDPDAGVGFDASTPDAGPPEADAGPPPGSTRIDASDSIAWTYVSLDTGLVTLDDPESSDAWDVAFRRSEVRTNSASSGAGVGGAKADDAAFEDITLTDTFDFAIDAIVDTGAPGSTPTSLNPILRAWYDYDPSAHSVTPKDSRYIVRGGDGAYYKLEILGWVSGVYTYRVGSIEHEAPVRELTLVTPDANAWVNLDLSQTYVEEADFTESRWDVSAARTLWRTNGGASGEGMAGVVLVERDLDALADIGAADFVTDTTIEPTRPGEEAYAGNVVLGDWFDYNPVTHVVAPKPSVFVVRRHTGDFAALQITAWEDGSYTLRIRYAGPRQAVFQ